MPDDVALDESPMIVQISWIVVLTEITEVYEPVVSSSKEPRLRLFDFLTVHHIRHRRAYRFGGSAQPPGAGPVPNTTHGEDQGELRRGLGSVLSDNLNSVESL